MLAVLFSIFHQGGYKSENIFKGSPGNIACHCKKVFRMKGKYYVAMAECKQLAGSSLDAGCWIMKAGGLTAVLEVPAGMYGDRNCYVSYGGG